MYIVRWGFFTFEEETKVRKGEIQRGEGKFPGDAGLTPALIEFLKRQSDPKWDWVILVSDASA